MRVALDMSPATTGSTGVARYARELASRLPAHGVALAMFAFGRGPHEPPVGTVRRGVPLRLVQRSWTVVGRPRAEDVVGAVDLVHCLDRVPIPSRAPLVMTAHDLLAVDLPELHSAAQIDQQHRQLRAFRKADLVLANSYTTGNSLVEHGVPQDRVVVARLGLTEMPAAVGPPRSRPYLLAVGELASRKNLPTLIRAFRAARLPEELDLVLAGPDGHNANETTELLGGRVERVGRIDDAALANLYRHAVALCFPSFAEGFGLPVLEAMSVGLPVIASDLPVLREVAADAVYFVAAGGERAWVTALETVVFDESLRTDLAKAGAARASQFSWEATARETSQAYGRLLGCA